MNHNNLEEIRNSQRSIGDAGEDYVLRLERDRLKGHRQIHKVHIAGRRDIGLGYDIISFHGLEDAEPNKYIEVKTYKGTPHFFLSQGEESAARHYRRDYYIYLVDIERINDEIYHPMIINDPITSLSENWHEKIQQREFTLAFEDVSTLPHNLDDSTVVVGCYNNDIHHSWIISNNSYNVRNEGNDTFILRGKITSDEVTKMPGYLLLYDGRDPRRYSMHSIDASKTATKSDMINWGYHNPHAHRYLLYHLKNEVPTPPIDIMELLRTNNDKTRNGSGVPLFMWGRDLRKYILKSSHETNHIAKYTNNGTPWTEYHTMQLSAMFGDGMSIEMLAHNLRRSPEEIHSKLRELGMEKG